MASAPPPAIEADSVTFDVGANRLVASVNLTVGAGEIVGILGANGAGKSTLLKLVSGEMAPTSGEIRFDGVPLARNQPALLARRRAVVPQASALTFPFAVHEVVLLGVTVPGFEASSGAYEAAERALRRVGLIDIAERRYTDLSGGERQRVHIARAMCQLATARCGAGETPLLLVDEPTSNLDIGHQRLVLDAVREMAAAGAAVLAVLHDINLAAAYCDRLALMRSGRLVANGPPHEMVSDAILSETFGCTLEANTVPSRTPFVLPVTRDAANRLHLDRALARTSR